MKILEWYQETASSNLIPRRIIQYVDFGATVGVRLVHVILF